MVGELRRGLAVLALALVCLPCCSADRDANILGHLNDRRLERGPRKVVAPPDPSPDPDDEEEEREYFDKSNSHARDIKNIVSTVGKEASHAERKAGRVNSDLSKYMGKLTELVDQLTKMTTAQTAYTKSVHEHFHKAEDNRMKAFADFDATLSPVENEEASDDGRQTRTASEEEVESSESKAQRFSDSSSSNPEESEDSGPVQKHMEDGPIEDESSESEAQRPSGKHGIEDGPIEDTPSAVA